MGSEVLKVGEKPELGLEPVLRYLPWASRDEVSALREEIDEVKKNLKEVLNNLAGTDSKIKELEGIKSSIEGKLASVGSELDSVRTELSKLEPVVFVSKLVGVWKGMTCSWVLEGVCTAWKLSSEVVNEIKKYFSDAALVNVNNDWKLAVKNVPYICAFCPLYKPKNGISTGEQKT